VESDTKTIKPEKKNRANSEDRLALVSVINDDFGEVVAA